MVVLLGAGVALETALVGQAERGAETAPALTTPTSGTPTGGAPAGEPTATVTTGLDPAVAPRIVVDHLEFGAARKAETAAYAKRHYGTATWRLTPTLIVLHYTESDTYASARSLFESDVPNRGELPGACSHYVIDKDGTIHELVPPTVMCRHTVGLNHLAIGIEFVQSSSGHDPRWAVQQVLRRRAQVAAGVALVEALQRRFSISDESVIGHAMANDAKGFRDLEGWRNDHLDWQRPEVVQFRSMLTMSP
nr:peptidoglycan recognition family protein [Pedococcus badiiscoriae]